VAGSPFAYREFVQHSWAELGIAKDGYVTSRCGWFSDRSACYLASGRPVLAQDTGFSAALPVGAGLFAFDSADQVAAAIEEIERDYPAQRRAARAVAEEYLAAEVVLDRLVERVGRAA
jgi:glycosyltransferase involved in cell wall biosynthesis